MSGSQSKFLSCVWIIVSWFGINKHSSIILISEFPIFFSLFSSIILFSFYEVLYTHFINLKKNESLFKGHLIKNKVYIKILKSLANIFFKIDGHSILLFLLLALNLKYASLTLIYMQFILFLNIFRLSYLLIKKNI